MGTIDFKSELEKKAAHTNDILKELLDNQHQIDTSLKEAIEYTLYAPGKRIRAAITMWACEMIAGNVYRNAEIAAAAIEMVHTYSLVHDDLPAMDDDDLRRGQPTCHKKFDEATAILTGDALLTLAFEILAKEVDDPAIAAKLIGQLAESAGGSGMIAGQMADLAGENCQCSKEMLEYIHTNKTAKMFQCSALCGAIAARANTGQLRALWQYGLNLGLAFQVGDDILDVCGNSEQLGKTAGKDEKARKCTYPALLGIEKSKEIETELANKAVAALGIFGAKADILKQLPIALLERTK